MTLNTCSSPFGTMRIFKREYPLILYATKIVVYMNTTQKYTE